MRMHYAVDDPIVEGKPVEQQKHTKSHHDDGQPERSGDEDALIDSEQRQHDGSARVQEEESQTDSRHQPDLFKRERFHIPLVCRDEDKQIDEAEHVIA